LIKTTIKPALWIKTLLRDGVHRFDPQAGTFTHCQFDPR
jgi:hypothetical protein